MNRRNVVIFLALIGIFVTYTQAFTVNTIEVNTEFSDLSKYTGPTDFLTTYDSKPLGKNKVLGTLTIVNQHGSNVVTYVTIIPTDSYDQIIEIDTPTTYQYKIGTGSWVTETYSDPVEMMAELEVTILSGGSKTIYVIFEKTNIAFDYYQSNIVVQEKI
ncbi:hypothetical protein MUP51_00410 [Candidatus Bathyarchaeota archaeon]|nr:hypothetical protein [Candidatus Bathyarchaeota archaeon]